MPDANAYSLGDPMRKTEIEWFNIVMKVSNEPWVEVEGQGPIPTESLASRKLEDYVKEHEREIAPGALYTLDRTDPPRGRLPVRWSLRIKAWEEFSPE